LAWSAVIELELELHRIVRDRDLAIDDLDQRDREIEPGRQECPYFPKMVMTPDIDLRKGEEDE